MLYTWVDEIPLSRPKRNIARDFSDGVLMAEVVHCYYPKLVELHNYSSANGMQQKLYNWATLNGKVFKRLGFTVSKQDCDACCNCEPGAVERVLKLIKSKLDKCRTDNGEAAIQVGQGAKAAGVPRSVSPPAFPSQQQLAAEPRPAPPAAGSIATKMQAAVMPEVIAEKDQIIAELRETNTILETKVRKLEQLVRLKDAKMQTLMAKLQAAGMA